MERRQKLMQTAIVIAILLLGLAFFRLGFVIFNSAESREPAAVQRVYDYSNLEGSALQKAAQERLLSGARVVSAGNSRGIELGHFLVRDKHGGISEACDFYDHLEMTFVAGDMAVSGEPPQLTLHGPCTADQDSLAILPLMFDYTPILDSPVGEKDLSDGLDKSIRLSFKNVSDAWPRVWVLQTVKLSGVQADDLLINQTDLRRILSKPPSLEW